jgi:phosphotriesterase-related protein
MQKQILRTVLGDISPDEMGLILPHEHLFTDLRGPEVEGYAQADPKLVLSVMLPFLKEAYHHGVTALMECSTIGVGRNIEVLRSLADNTRVHLLAPTGLYREEYIPSIYRDQSVEEIAELFIYEITNGIGMSSSKAGFIKIALSNDGPRPIEKPAPVRKRVRRSPATQLVEKQPWKKLRS